MLLLVTIRVAEILLLVSLGLYLRPLIHANSFRRLRLCAGTWFLTSGR